MYKNSYRLNGSLALCATLAMIVSSCGQGANSVAGTTSQPTEAAGEAVQSDHMCGYHTPLEEILASTPDRPIPADLALRRVVSALTDGYGWPVGDPNANVTAWYHD